MKKKISLALVCALVAVCTLSLASCNNVTQSITLPARTLRYSVDDSIPYLAGSASASLLSNIDRGFRTEVYYTLGSGRAWPDSEDDGYEALEETLAYYAEDSPVEIQVYIYLNEYADRALDDAAFNQLKTFMETIRSKRLSMLLRFAYDPNQGDWISPAQDLMLSHLAQLKTFFSRERNLFEDTVTALQFGCIGAWGEWGATGEKYDETKVLNAIIDTAPDGTYFQGRYMRVTNKAKRNARYDHVGYHNDFLVGRPHPWNTAGDDYSSRDYKYFNRTAPLRMNDGEMPWGGHSDEPDEIIDGLKLAVQLAEHSMNTLSIQHNYKENRDDPTPPPYNMERWKSEYVTAAILDAHNLPRDPAYFLGADGKEEQRSVFEYIRDYLGYRLTLSNLSTESDGANVTVKFIVTNYGFGTPLTLDKLELAASDESGDKYYYVDGFDVSALTSGGQLSLSLTLPKSLLEGKRLGVRITRHCSAGDYYIATANSLGFENGINRITAA